MRELITTLAFIIFFVGIIILMFTWVNNFRSHECSWYKEQDIVSSQVPYRCFEEAK